jgi:hypothetical protein
MNISATNKGLSRTEMAIDKKIWQLCSSLVEQNCNKELQWATYMSGCADSILESGTVGVICSSPFQ